MRSRGRSKQKRRASGSGVLAKTSQEPGDKLISCANEVGSSMKETDDSSLHLDHSAGVPQSESERNEYQAFEPVLPPKTLETGHCSGNIMRNDSLKEKCDDVNLDKSHLNNKEDLDDSDWEEGSIASDDHPMTIELNVTPDLSTQKRIRRASAQDKGFAELVHKVHLLCLLSRGRLIDRVCDDPLIQASLLSLLPAHLLQLSNVTKLTSKALHPLVAWFHNNFHVRKFTSAEISFRSALTSALETREGSFEEIAALSVALFRALKLTTRFVYILDVASLKPGQSVRSDASGSSKGIFNASTVMVSRPEEDFRPPKFSGYVRENSGESSLGQSHKKKEGHSTSHVTESRNPPFADELNGSASNSQNSETEYNNPDCITNKIGKSKRKGDLEFEMQLEMALSATKIRDENKKESCSRILNANSEIFNCSSKKIKRIISDESLTFPHEISTTVGPMKFGSPLYWAEVYCEGENLTGKWVHIDAINLIIDGEHKVESMVAACRTSLRYVLAFAGQGAKDVTRRYCTKWHKIASQRVSSMWWDSVLAPLRELESGTTGGVVHSETNQTMSAESSKSNFFVPTRSSLEDIEFETRALTEPLPTNQQAYRSHPLYALERWLNKYQVLHPRGPILGFCSGLPVYPRTCVQTLKTKGRWLREGLQVKANEHPAKVLKSSVKKLEKVQGSEADYDDCSDSKENIELYGKWQLEPLNLPHAVNGIVPKNERGQVEVWSEKCLPPGTVHLRFPKAFAVAKRLEIDYAPAMVGFEFKNGRSHPVFDGIVVCDEFKDVLLEAYAEEEERTRAEEKKRDKARALSRWYQLLSSIVTRQRLNNRYNNSLPLETTSTDNQPRDNKELNAMVSGPDTAKVEVPSYRQTSEHEHVFLKEHESFDEESSLLTKRCQCGFSVQVEQL